MAAARLHVLLGRGNYIARIKEHSNKSPILAFIQVCMIIQIQPNCNDLDLRIPNSCALRTRVASQGLIEPPDQEDCNHGSVVTQPSLPSSMETNVILPMKVCSSVTKCQETHWPRQRLNKKVSWPVTGADGLTLAPDCRRCWGFAEHCLGWLLGSCRDLQEDNWL